MPKSKRQAQPEQERADRTFDAMRHYVEQHERDAPMAFVGRTGILNDLMSAVESTSRGAKGMTRVVQGVPGAGKTAVCDEFISRNQNKDISWVDKDGRKHESALFCLNLDPEDLNTPPLTFVQGLHEQWVDHCRNLEASMAKAGRAHLSRMSDIARLWLKRSTEHESAVKIKALTEHSSLSTCIGAYSHDYWGKSKLAIALCIDEAQDLLVTDRTKATLRILHNRTHPANITPLLFGLPNTLNQVSDRLHGLGLSRLNVKCVHDIYLLEPGEAREIVDGTFDKLELNWENPDWSGHLRSRGFKRFEWDDWRSQIADAIAEGSSDFPQHVTLGLHAACQALIERRETLDPDDLGDMLEDVRAKHQQRKTSYYQQRLDSIIHYGAAFGAICRKAAESPVEGVTHAEAKRAIAVGSSADDEPLDSAQANAVLKQALGTGVLKQLQNGRLTPPAIPSMTSYLDDILQNALDLNERHAARACQAIGLSMPPTETPAPA